METHLMNRCDLGNTSDMLQHGRFTHLHSHRKCSYVNTDRFYPDFSPLIQIWLNDSDLFLNILDEILKLELGKIFKYTVYICIYTCTKHDLVLGGKTLVVNHRGQTVLVVGHQVCTHLRRDFVPLLFADPLQFIKDSRLTFGNSNLQLPPQIFYGMKVWRLARPLQDLNVLHLETLLCCIG